MEGILDIGIIFNLPNGFEAPDLSQLAQSAPGVTIEPVDPDRANGTRIVATMRGRTSAVLQTVGKIMESLPERSVKIAPSRLLEEP